jgi:hypothetical protein
MERSTRDDKRFVRFFFSLSSLSLSLSPLSLLFLKRCHHDVTLHENTHPLSLSLSRVTSLYFLRFSLSASRLFSMRLFASREIDYERTEGKLEDSEESEERERKRDGETDMDTSVSLSSLSSFSSLPSLSPPRIHTHTHTHTTVCLLFMLVSSLSPFSSLYALYAFFTYIAPLLSLSVKFFLHHSSLSLSLPPPFI